MAKRIRQKRFWLVISLLLLTCCSRFDLVNGLVPSNGYNRTKNVAYGRLPRQTLDIYQPKGVKTKAGIVIFFYGGYWSSGNKEDYRFVGQALTSKGFIAVLPDYRLYPSVTFPAFVMDGACAVKWAHDHASALGGDTSHIYVMGHSAGAHIAALLTLDPQYLKAFGLDRKDIRAMAGLAGPYDFRIGQQSRPVFGLNSTTAPVDPKVEPINCVDGAESPMLLLQGAKDTTVDPGNALRLARRIKLAGGEVKVIIYPSRGHAGVVQAMAFPFRWLDPVLQDCATFFKEH